MAKKEHIQDQVDRYLRNKMDTEERLLFESKLQQDKSLMEEVESSQPVYALVEAAGGLALKKELVTLEVELTQAASQGAVRSFRRPFSWAAAAAIIFLALAGWWWFGQGPSSPQELYAAYYAPYEAPINVRSGEATDIWQQAVVAYEKEDFVKAARLFSQAESDPFHPQYLIHFYEAISLMGQTPPQTKAAILLLEKVLEGDNDYQDTARWYLALGHLQLGQPDQARQRLQELENSGYKVSERKRLLRSLK